MKKTIVNLTQTLAVLLLFGQCANAATTQYPTYSLSFNDISQLLMPALNLTKPEADASKEDQLVKLQQAPQASPYEQYTTTFDLFQSSSTKLNTTSLSPLPVLMHDLNVLCFSSKDATQRNETLLSKINKDIITCAGNVSLAHILSHPLADAHELRERQAVIAALAYSPALLEFDTLLSAFHGDEATFFGCYKKPTKAEQTQINRVFFTRSVLKNLNTNEWAMGIAARLGDLNVITPIIFCTLVPAVLQYRNQKHMQTLAEIADPTANPDAAAHEPLRTLIWDAFKDEMSSLNLVSRTKACNKGYNELIDKLKAQRIEYEEDWSRARTDKSPSEKIQQAELKLNMHTATLNFCKSKIGYGISLVNGLLGAAYQYWWFISTFRLQMTIHAIDAYLQSQLIGCAALVRTFDALMEQTKNQPELRYLVTSWESTCSPHSAAFEKLLGMLRTPTFSGTTSWLSHLGRVRAAYALMRETQQEFGDMLRFVGMCDAYQALAQLYLKHKDSSAPYSFVTFVGQETPYIKATGFWNPMLDPEKAIANNLELGISPTSSARVAVVTGSNSGGKSTIMVTGLISLVLLAQTTGLVPTQELIMTPFDYLATSLKVQDNIAAGKSHFVAETEQASTLVHTVQSLEDKKAFLAIDELFEGTSPVVGEKSLHDLLEKLSGFSNLLVSVATQYQGQPTALEAETNGLCRNMKVDVLRNERGMIERPHKLEVGVSQVSVGAQLLQQAMEQKATA